MFRIGQKVVCVDLSPSCRGVLMPFVKDRVYTVSNTIDTWEGQGVELAEVETPAVVGHFRAWNASRFRPVVERKTDISIFKAMLNPSSRETEVA